MKNFSEVFAENDNEEDNNFWGAFREIGELLVLLVELYFFLNDAMGVIELSWFDEQNGLSRLLKWETSAKQLQQLFIVWDQLFRIILKYVKVLQASY